MADAGTGKTQAALMALMYHCTFPTNEVRNKRRVIYVVGDVKERDNYRAEFASFMENLSNLKDMLKKKHRQPKDQELLLNIKKSLLHI